MAEQIDLFGQTEVEVIDATPATWRYQRRAVPGWACVRSLSVLADYCAQTGQRLGAFRFDGRPSEALTRITGAVLDHPEIAEARWTEVIASTLRDPWWSGSPSVGCVFGPAIVEKNICDSAAGVSRGRLTSNGQLLRAIGGL